MSISLHHGDCLEVMKEIPDGSIDMVMTDPPYGTTACKWDTAIDLDVMWTQLKRVIKPNGAIVMTASQPFTTRLIASNYQMFKYCWVWDKTTVTGHLNAKKMPMKAHEDICVFYKTLPTYNPIKTVGHERKTSLASHRRNCKIPDVYSGHHYNMSYDSTERYPRSVVTFATDKQKVNIHPTQKPVALMEYLVKTYTNQGETVLDFTMGSGTTGVACQNLDRDFIGIELDETYFKVASDRLGYSTSLEEGLTYMKNIELKFTFETTEEVQEFLAGHSINPAMPTPAELATPVVTPQAAPAATVLPPILPEIVAAAAPSPVELANVPPVTPVAAPAGGVTTQVAAPAGGVTTQVDVKNAMRQYKVDHGVKAYKELLGYFGAVTVRDIPKNEYTAVVQMAEGGVATTASTSVVPAIDATVLPSLSTSAMLSDPVVAISPEQLRVALGEHKARWGMVATKAVLERLGYPDPNTIPAEKYGELVTALNTDDPSAVAGGSIDLSAF